MKIECIGGPLDGETRVLHEGNAFVLVGKGAYRVSSLFAWPIVVRGEETVRALWYPENNDVEDDGA